MQYARRTDALGRKRVALSKGHRERLEVGKGGVLAFAVEV